MVGHPARFSFAHGGKDGFPYPVDTGALPRPSRSCARRSIARVSTIVRARLEANEGGEQPHGKGIDE